MLNGHNVSKCHDFSQMLYGHNFCIVWFNGQDFAIFYGGFHSHDSKKVFNGHEF